MNVPETKYEDCVVFLLAKAYQKAHANFKKHLIAYGLTPIQHLILEALWQEDGQSAGDIGKKLVLDVCAGLFRSFSGMVCLSFRNRFDIRLEMSPSSLAG